MENIDKLLQEFCGKDKRKKDSTPSLDGDFVFAVDGWKGIKIPKKYLANKYSEVLNFPKIDNIINGVTPQKEYTVTVDDIQEAIKDLPTRNIYKKVMGNCEECYGTGQVECPHCGQDMDCENCDGTGSALVDGEEIENTEVDGTVSIEDVKINANFVRLVADAMKLTNNKIATIWTQSATSGVLFLFGEIKIILMPLLRETSTPKKLNVKENTQCLEC